ncbi:hypothetical protein NHX12_003238 [Muraenolepis orangiensis]|uniref:Uncharacterized protein n=1 Tax=Muraenolepis orangiensis TaxID=630683 RepID=A0A9Q0E0D0_9TELE|nr:hypothetical protein NHX12_003238 [Muraenolepis orangiensis]
MVTRMIWPSCWSVVEQGLNQDMGILAAYLRKWRLQLSTGKTVGRIPPVQQRGQKGTVGVRRQQAPGAPTSPQVPRCLAGQDTVLQTAP